MPVTSQPQSERRLSDETASSRCGASERADCHGLLPLRQPTPLSACWAVWMVLSAASPGKRARGWELRVERVAHRQPPLLERDVKHLPSSRKTRHSCRTVSVAPLRLLLGVPCCVWLRLLVARLQADPRLPRPGSDPRGRASPAVAELQISRRSGLTRRCCAC